MTASFFRECKTGAAASSTTLPVSIVAVVTCVAA